MLLDEFAARLDLIAHERREHVICREHIFDPHLHQAAGLRIDGRVPELLRVHLSEALVALNGLAFLRLIEEPGHALLEAADLVPLIAAHHVGALADEPSEGAPQIRDVLILGGLEELARQKLVAGRPMLGFVNDDPGALRIGSAAHLHTERARAVVHGTQAAVEFLRPVAQPVALRKAARRHFGHVDELLEQPVVIAAGPASDDRLHPDVLAREQLQCRAADRRRARIDMHRRILERRVEQQRIKLGIVLDVVLLLAALDLVERRLRDEDMPALDEHTHLTVEERQQERADVAAINVRVGVVRTQAAHAGDEIFISLDGEVVNVAPRCGYLIQGLDRQRHQVPVQEFELQMRLQRRYLRLQRFLEPGRARVILPKRPQFLELIAGADRDDPQGLLALTGRGAHRPRDIFGPALRHRADDIKRT